MTEVKILEENYNQTVTYKIQEQYGEVLREPVEPIDRIKQSLKKVPRKVIKALKKLHNAKWNVSETLDSVVILNDNHRAVLNQLMGVVPTEGAMHQHQRDSNEAANRDKNNDLDTLLEANKEEGKLKDFYFSYELQGHHRVLQQGKINPQHSKVTRFLLRSWEAQTYNKDNLWKFKLAVAQNFGLDIDKNNMAYAETEFGHIVNNGNVQEAVKAMQVLKEDKNNKEAANKLAKALSEIKSTSDYKDVNIQLLFLDSNQVILDSLYYTDTERILSSALIGRAPELKTYKRTHTATEIQVTKNRLDKIARATQVIIKGQLATTNGGVPLVKIYSDYELEIKLAVRAKIKLGSG